MKKMICYIGVLSVAAVLFSSCHKNYTCKCQYFPVPGAPDYSEDLYVNESTNLNTSNYTEAKAQCDTMYAKYHYKIYDGMCALK
jgi:hypothetical protein